jgi:multisubunit Na+/H+ antiporter MnhB subunit
MDIQTIAVLAVALFLSLLAVFRTYPRRRWATALVLLLPAIVFSVRWARYRDAWAELGIGAGVALFGLIVWWFLLGRKIPPPQESSIRVWSKDDPF